MENLVYLKYQKRPIKHPEIPMPQFMRDCMRKIWVEERRAEKT